jgi:hypothetical protein
MSKVVKQLVTWIWISIASFLSLCLGTLLIGIMLFVNSSQDGAPYYKYTSYARPISEVILTQVVLSLWFLVISLALSFLVLRLSKRLGLFVKLTTPPYHQFHSLMIRLCIFALISIGIAGAIGNALIIHDQILGRERFRQFLDAL